MEGRKTSKKLSFAEKNATFGGCLQNSGPNKVKRNSPWFQVFPCSSYNGVKNAAVSTPRLWVGVDFTTPATGGATGGKSSGTWAMGTSRAISPRLFGIKSSSKLHCSMSIPPCLVSALVSRLANDGERKWHVQSLDNDSCSHQQKIMWIPASAKSNAPKSSLLPEIKALMVVHRLGSWLQLIRKSSTKGKSFICWP